MITDKIGIEAIDHHLDKDDIDEQGKMKLTIIANVLANAVNDISKKMDISVDETKESINKKLENVQYFVNESEDVIVPALVDQSTNTMKFGNRFFYDPTANKNEITVHELTHLMGFETLKPNPLKTRYVCGYKTIDKILWMHKVENAGFNEAATQMFASYNNEYYNDKFLRYDIYTNQSEHQSIYKININLIHQMVIAKGLTDKDLFKGLFNYNDAKEFMGKYDKTTFTELSQLIDTIYDNAFKLSQTRNSLYNKADRDIGKLIDDEMHATVRIKIATQDAERKIMNKILVPELQNKTEEEKQAILAEYGKYVVSEKEHFNQITQKAIGKSQFIEQLKTDTVVKNNNHDNSHDNQNDVSNDKSEMEKD